MRIDALQSLVEGIKTTFECPKCHSKVTEKGIDVLGIAGNNVNMDIVCEKCQTHTLFNSSLITLDLGINKEQLNKTINGIQNKLKTNNTKISDKEITSLNKDLKKDQINVEDLFD